MFLQCVSGTITLAYPLIFRLHCYYSSCCLRQISGFYPDQPPGSTFTQDWRLQDSSLPSWQQMICYGVSIPTIAVTDNPSMLWSWDSTCGSFESSINHLGIAYSSSSFGISATESALGRMIAIPRSKLIKTEKVFELGSWPRGCNSSAITVTQSHALTLRRTLPRKCNTRSSMRNGHRRARQG